MLCFIFTQIYSELVYGEEDYLETTEIDMNIQGEEIYSGMELEVVVVGQNLCQSFNVTQFLVVGERVGDLKLNSNN